MFTFVNVFFFTALALLVVSTIVADVYLRRIKDLPIPELVGAVEETFHVYCSQFDFVTVSEMLESGAVLEKFPKWLRNELKIVLPLELIFAGMTLRLRYDQEGDETPRIQNPKSAVTEENLAIMQKLQKNHHLYKAFSAVRYTFVLLTYAAALLKAFDLINRLG